MIVLQPLHFPKDSILKWGKEPWAQPRDWSGLAEGGRVIFLWVRQRGRALRKKLAILPNLCSFCILCSFSLSINLIEIR